MYVYVCIYMCVLCVYIYLHTYGIPIRYTVYVYVCIHPQWESFERYAGPPTCVCTYVDTLYMCTSTYLHTYICVCAYVKLCTCIYPRTHTHGIPTRYTVYVQACIHAH